VTYPVTMHPSLSASLATSTEWEREDGGALPQGAEQRGSRLEFRRIRSSDAGVYICTARNSLGSATLYTTVIVEGPPSELLLA